MNEQDSRRSKGNKSSNRHSILWAICGAYLLYLAYKLLGDYFSGAAAEAGSEMICIIGGGAFVLVGLFLLIVAARQGFRAMQENAREMARVEEEDRLAEENARRIREAEADEDDDDVTEADDSDEKME